MKPLYPCRRRAMLAAALLCWALTLPTSGFAQSLCGTMDHYPELVNPDATLQQAWRLAQDKIAEHYAQGKTFDDGSLLIIPTVIHVVYGLNVPPVPPPMGPGPPEGTAGNISEAQCNSQIEALNEDFRRLLGTPGHNTHPDGADVNIEFRLAVRDPDGNPTTGITRTYLPGVYDPILGFDATIKPATIWDANRYLNVWAADLVPPFLGYAQFPEDSGLAGMPPAGEPQGEDTDGVVNIYGSTGRTGHLVDDYDGGRTGTHEIGHMLGLRHIWGDTDCSGDDFVADTPNAADSNGGCPVVNTCDDTATMGSDPNDMVENYMDYTYDGCMNIFTLLQNDRMRSVMTCGDPAGLGRCSPRRASLVDLDPAYLTANGPNMSLVPVIPGQPNVTRTHDVSVTEILAPSGNIAQDVTLNLALNDFVGVTPMVVLENHGETTLTSAVIDYQVNGGAVQSFNWTGSLPKFGTTPVALPAINVAHGATYSFTATAHTPNGVADQVAGNNSYTSNFASQSVETLPFTEDFTGATFPPAGWSLINGRRLVAPQETWQRGDLATAPGTVNPTPGGVAWMNHRNYDDPMREGSVGIGRQFGAEDELHLPTLRMGGYQALEMTFDLSYSRYKDQANVIALQVTNGDVLNLAPNESDRLKVLVSNDGGATWDEVYNKSGWDSEGNQLPTGPDTNVDTSDGSMPTLPTSEFRTETIDLSAYDFQNILVKFVTENGNGNNLYVDNVSVTGTITGLPVELAVFSAVVEGTAVQLRWQTATETDNAGFEVEHSNEAEARDTWHSLAFVEGAGSTQQPQAYAYRVDALAAGVHRFRLKQIDFDGTVTYSPVVEATVVPEHYMLMPAYPNPFNPTATLRFAVAQEQTVHMGLYDLLGRPLQILYDGRLEAGHTQTVRLDGRALPSGTYLVRLTGETFTADQTVTLLK